MTEKEQYNYDTFAKKEYGYTSFREQLRVGSRAPDLEAQLLDGGVLKSLELKGKSNLLLAFASITCPPSIECIKSGPNSLERLYEEYRNRDFQFYIVYVREAHPGESIPHHDSYEQKKTNAERMRSEEQVNIPIIIDSIDGAIHRTYGLLPNMLYVINKQGIIVYRSDWVDTEELRQLFDNLLAWEAARAQNEHHKVAFSERLHYVPENGLGLRRRVYLRAGVKAVKDYGKSMHREPF